MDFQPGKCYEVTFVDGRKIKFKFLGGATPIVEVNGERKGLLEILVGYIGYREVDC